MTREEYFDLRLAAEHCDDYTQYRREIEQIERQAREAGLIGIRRNPEADGQKPVRFINNRRPTGRVRARDARHAALLITGGKHHV